MQFVSFLAKSTNTIAAALSLPLMVNSISEAQLEEVINRLSQHLSGKEELRDIASIGIQSFIFLFFFPL